MDSLLNLIDKEISKIEENLASKNHSNQITKIKDHNKLNYLSRLHKLKYLKTKFPTCISECQNLDQIEKLALAKLNLNAVSYFISGANSEITLKRNKDFFKRILIKPRIFRNTKSRVAFMNNQVPDSKFPFKNEINSTCAKKFDYEKDEINLTTKILGREVSLPIGFSPSALHKLAHEDGEISSARAAYRNNAIFILSSRASATIAEVAEANQTGVRWFQLYAMKNCENNIRMIREAEKHGFSALVLTVDAPTIGYRDRDFQSKFKKPDNIYYAIEKHLLETKNKEIEKEKSFSSRNNENNNNSTINHENIIRTPNNDKHNLQIINKEKNVAFDKITKNNETNFNESIKLKNEEETPIKINNFNYYKNSTDSSLDWSIIAWLREVTKLPIILKGITNKHDAARAADYNINGIIISNHGGRQLDTSPSTIEVLEVIKNELEIFYKKFPHKQKMELYIDSGFRTGSDVFKGLAYGAKAVFLGRPVVWGLAAGGENGVCKVLDILRDELAFSMMIAGCSDISEIFQDCIYNDYHAKF